MTINAAQFQKLLDDFQLSSLFIDELGWDKPMLRPHSVLLNGHTFTLTQIAHKRGVSIFLCSPDALGFIPTRDTLLKIDKETTKLSYEHLLIFSDSSHKVMTWLWVARLPGQPAVTRTHTWHKGTSGEGLRQKLNQIVWTLEEEEVITLNDVINRLSNAFDRDRVTNRFYEHFKAEHQVFLNFIEGIDVATEQAWYASLLLNRLMFVYFIQKKGFLDGNQNYLSDRMQKVREQAGEGKFHTFYRKFLLHLFHDGLGKHKKSRDSDLSKLIGDVPYLNGGLFDVHDLEFAHPNIDIPDEAFERLFSFFDTYDWHLDDRPLSSGDEINPDVLGYIFEKYINQKQIGAYYTKEDITEYISKNTVIPHLLDKTKEHCKIAFEGESSIWSLLIRDPDRYIYPSMKTGVIDSYGKLIPESALPKFVQDGMSDFKFRMFDHRYNTGEAVLNLHTTNNQTKNGTLSTETWREYVDRRSRCLTLREKLANGEITNTDDLITLNLDIRQFMQDVIDSCTSTDLLRAVWQAIVGLEPEHSNDNLIRGISILDPMCGSGAFLFAALNVLEPLYESCLERMEGFVEDAKKLGKPEEIDFNKVLKEVGHHHSRKYFIYKNIILNNLFGVDIMSEAVEICKLRLFLKLVSQIETVKELEPLPDIDFNIRAGNSLVGYTTELQFNTKTKKFKKSNDLAEINSIAATLSDEIDFFRRQQINYGDKTTHVKKHKLRDDLNNFSNKLDSCLAKEYDINLENNESYLEWRINHKPFHWFLAFNGIMRDGGFNVVIGNPPYIATRRITEYTVKEYETSACTDMYAWCLERVVNIASQNARTGMIIPMSLSFSGDFSTLRNYLYKKYRKSWFSHYAKRPSMLFSGVQIRNVIHIAAVGDEDKIGLTTKLHRWYSEARPHLFEQLTYSKYQLRSWNCIPKIQGDLIINNFEKRNSLSINLQSVISRRLTDFPIYFKKIGYNWISFGEFIPPAFDQHGQEIDQNEFGVAYINNATDRDLMLLLLNGKIAFTYWILVGDDFHLTKGNFVNIPFNFEKISDISKKILLELAIELKLKMKESIVYMTMHGKRLGNFNSSLCRSITEKSDKIFAQEFDLISVWDDIELLYSQIVKRSAETETINEE
jgi:hypothetical protein